MEMNTNIIVFMIHRFLNQNSTHRNMEVASFIYMLFEKSSQNAMHWNLTLKVLLRHDSLELKQARR